MIIKSLSVHLKSPVPIRFILSVVAVLMLGSCVTFSMRNADVYQYLQRGDLLMAQEALDAQYRNRRDHALYELNKGMLLHLSGDYTQSSVLLESGKKRVQSLEATSISENLAAVAINEASRSYVAQPYEQLLLYAYKALNYLARGEIDSARVEMLQVDVRLREWASAKEVEGVHASAFVRYLSGLIYESLGEHSDALIAYRKAYEVLEKNQQSIPGFLKRDLLSLTKHQGLLDEHQRFVALFASTDWVSVDSLEQQSELIVIYGQGVVTPMAEQLIYLFSPVLAHNVQIAIPYYPEFYPAHSSLGLEVNGNYYQTQIIDSIDQLARESLAARTPGITLRTMARIVVKKKLAREARQEHALAGFVADIVGLVTERADTRSWSTLPSNIQIARISLPPGQHQVSVLMQQQTINLAAGQKKIIAISDIANR